MKVKKKSGLIGSYYVIKGENAFLLKLFWDNFLRT